MGTAATRAKNKYNKTKYDRINLTVPIDFKDKIKEAAVNSGESVNGYISHILKDKMQSEDSTRVDDKPNHFRFSVFYNEELVSDVDAGEKTVRVRRYTSHPAKQIFYADEFPRYKLGEILALRCWDRDRADINDCLSKLGLNTYDPYAICRKTHGITYADRIWFRYEGEFFDGVKALEELANV